MDKIIAACGNDCSKCPRHLPKSEKELEETASLWLRIGYRDRAVSTEEISCLGCSTDNWCRYKIIDCTTKKGVSNCGECSQYPCDIVKECFEVTLSFEPQCKKCCNSLQYKILKKAFFEKKNNLDSIYAKNKRL